MAISPERMAQLQAMAEKIKSNPQMMTQILGTSQTGATAPSLQERLRGGVQTKGTLEDATKTMAKERGIEGQQNIIDWQQEQQKLQQTRGLASPFLENVTPEGMEVSGVTVGPDTISVAYKRGPEAEAAAQKIQDKAAAEFKTPSGDVSGRMALAKVGTDYVKSAKRVLFPDDKPESFNRLIATMAKIDKPLQQVGTLFPGIDQKDVQDAQDVMRWLDNAISGKVLIKTGVAARPEEVEIERRSYIPGLASSPESAYKAMNELTDFYNAFFSLMDPGGEFKKRIEGDLTDVSKMSDEQLLKLATEGQ